MFSTTQNLFLKDFIPSILKDDYSYYIAYTNTTTSSGWNTTTECDLIVIISTEPIVGVDGYNFTFSGECKLFQIRTSNYSSSSSSNNSERIISSDFNSANLSVDIYEFVYTNAEFSSLTLQPDIDIGERVSNAYMQANNIIIAVFLLSYLILYIWHIRK